MKKSITLTVLMALSLVSAACSNFVGYENSTDANFNQEVLFIPPVKEGNGFHSFYAHLSVVLVKEGDKVERNKIGEVGNTGYSSGPHLHFAVYKDGKAVNPLDFLGKKREIQKAEWEQTEKTHPERK